MKVKKDYILRSVAGNRIVVPIGEEAAKFNGMITLNETGAFLWGKMKEDTCEEALVLNLLDEYEVSRKVATAGVWEFLNKMREADLLEE